MPFLAISSICGLYSLSELEALIAGSQPGSPTGWNRSWKLGPRPLWTKGKGISIALEGGGKKMIGMSTLVNDTNSLV
jgi:hypothetical protein